MASLTIVLSVLVIYCASSQGQRGSYYNNYNRPDYKSRNVNNNNFYRRNYYHNSYAPSTVGFTVAKTMNQVFTGDGLVTFDRVITNVGKAFQASDSQIKVPTTGLYYFSFFVQTNSTDMDTLDLVKNGDKIVSAMGLNGANAAVLFVRKGDKVSVRARANTVIISDSANSKASFSGFLIKSGYFDDKQHY